MFAEDPAAFAQHVRSICLCRFIISITGSLLIFSQELDRVFNPQLLQATSQAERADTAIYYRRGRLNAAINIRNLFNTDYFRASDGGRLFLFRGEPFTIIGSISWEF